MTQGFLNHTPLEARSSACGRTPPVSKLNVICAGRRRVRFVHPIWISARRERADLSLGERDAFVVGQCGYGTLEFREVSLAELAELGPGAAPRP